ncbi:MAG: hypothetical protein HUJ18_06150 [Marinobacter sp.]|nr:hypothetical protein [Marinobacter sp.]
MTNNHEASANDYLRPLRHLSVYLSGLVKGRLWLKVLVGQRPFSRPGLRR